MQDPNGLTRFDGHNCVRLYARLLKIAREDGVHFQLDSGYRSIREQWRLWWKYKAGKGPIAAFPGTSTHNKKSWKQGLDIGPGNDGTQAFVNWAHKHHMLFIRTVNSEFWHLNAAKNYQSQIDALWRAHYA